VASCAVFLIRLAEGFRLVRTLAGGRFTVSNYWEGAEKFGSDYLFYFIFGIEHDYKPRFLKRSELNEKSIRMLKLSVHWGKYARLRRFPTGRTRLPLVGPGGAEGQQDNRHAWFYGMSEKRTFF
jgi:hypothetical protein